MGTPGDPDETFLALTAFLTDFPEPRGHHDAHSDAGVRALADRSFDRSGRDHDQRQVHTPRRGDRVTDGRVRRDSQHLAALGVDRQDSPVVAVLGQIDHGKSSHGSDALGCTNYRDGSSGPQARQRRWISERSSHHAMTAMPSISIMASSSHRRVTPTSVIAG